MHDCGVLYTYNTLGCPFVQLVSLPIASVHAVSTLVSDVWLDQTAHLTTTRLLVRPSVPDPQRLQLHQLVKRVDFRPCLLVAGKRLLDHLLQRVYVALVRRLYRLLLLQKRFVSQSFEDKGLLQAHVRHLWGRGSSDSMRLRLGDFAQKLARHGSPACWRAEQIDRGVQGGVRRVGGPAPVLEREPPKLYEFDDGVNAGLVRLQSQRRMQGTPRQLQVVADTCSSWRDRCMHPNIVSTFFWSGLHFFDARRDFANAASATRPHSGRRLAVCSLRSTLNPCRRVTRTRRRRALRA
mmetsp:Transcript_54370/g.151460  ORF Transcript_54370/g.151460 Transcript_54370/m.151460 type:complete len:294 (-) Transcript_54370:2-883(-)